MVVLFGFFGFCCLLCDLSIVLFFGDFFGGDGFVDV